RTTEQTLILSKLFVKHARTVQAKWLRFVKGHHAIAVIQNVGFERAVGVGMSESDARLDELVKVIHKILSACLGVKHHHAAGPRFSGEAPIRETENLFDEWIVVLQ